MASFDLLVVEDWIGKETRRGVGKLATYTQPPPLWVALAVFVAHRLIGPVG